MTINRTSSSRQQTKQEQKTDVTRIIDGLFEVLCDAVAQGEKVTVPGWLSVERTDRAARNGRNPGEAIRIAAGHSVRISAGSKLKAAATK